VDEDRRSAPHRRPLTLRDVAEAANVSEMTVSRALAGGRNVSDRTRRRVEEAARRLGYVPNRIAGALASNRVDLVGVIIPSLSNLVFPEVLTGISDVLETGRLQPVIGVTNYLPTREERVLHEMLSWRPSGVIIAGIEHPDPVRAMLLASGVPVVEIMDTDGEPVDAVVGISQRRAGREMAEAIHARGYRRIGFLGTKMPLDHRARKRLEGFEAGLAVRGVRIEDREFYEGGSALAKGRDMTASILARSPGLDFLYYSNDMIGAGGLLWCLDHGLDVPGRIGLAGFNGTELLEGLPKRLATMDAGRREIGRIAARIVADAAMGREPADGRRVELVPLLQPGDTMRVPA
jgi:LacI family gluconate utilization system Gnt-I transcriptional repressor